MSTAATEAFERAPSDIAGSPFTLAVDIGGTNIKAAVLDCSGYLVASQIRTPTPKQATPQAVAELDRQLRLNESVLRTKVIRPDAR